jgi:hypothetical protein
MEFTAGKQLQRELDETVKREADENYVDGINKSLLFQMIPTEIRHHIWSYLVVVPENIHIYTVKSNVKQGFRLSRCGDAYLSLKNGWCDCSGVSLRPNPTQPAFLDTELLLVGAATCEGDEVLTRATV